MALSERKPAHKKGTPVSRGGWTPKVRSFAGPNTSVSQSGPAARALVSPLEARSSVLALNEAGLKNTAGLSGVTSRLAYVCAPVGEDALAITKSSYAGPQKPGRGLRPKKGWTLLWAFTPSYTSGEEAFIGPSFNSRHLEGRALSALTTRSLLYRGAASSPLASKVGLSGRVERLGALMAGSDFSQGPAEEFVGSPLEFSHHGYVPLSSHISASRRLRVTKGVTLPSDIPMHVICGSKDVIHS